MHRIADAPLSCCLPLRRTPRLTVGLPLARLLRLRKKRDKGRPYACRRLLASSFCFSSLDSLSPNCALGPSVCELDSREPWRIGLPSRLRAAPRVRNRCPLVLFLPASSVSVRGSSATNPLHACAFTTFIFSVDPDLCHFGHLFLANARLSGGAPRAVRCSRMFGSS